MRTARLPTTGDLAATARCQYQLGVGYRSHVQRIGYRTNPYPWDYTLPPGPIPSSPLWTYILNTHTLPPSRPHLTPHGPILYPDGPTPYPASRPIPYPWTYTLPPPAVDRHL